jgi:hypothetical protein
MTGRVIRESERGVIPEPDTETAKIALQQAREGNGCTVRELLSPNPYTDQREEWYDE